SAQGTCALLFSVCCRMQSPSSFMAFQASHTLKLVPLLLDLPAMANRVFDTTEDSTLHPIDQRQRVLGLAFASDDTLITQRGKLSAQFRSASSSLASVSGLPLTDFTSRGEGQLSGIEYKQLGQGFCVNQNGDHPKELGNYTGTSNADARSCVSESPWSCVSDVDDVGRSPACAERCSSMPHCAGYVVKHSGLCGLIAEEGFLPSGGDSTSFYSCFSKHTFKYNTSVTPGKVPNGRRILWSYWFDDAWSVTGLTRWLGAAARTPLSSGSAGRPSVVQLSQDSWRALNPEYEVRMVTDETLFQWVDRSDLPPKFDVMLAAQRSDAVRLAVVAKYGGVWIDASSVMLRPLRDVLGEDGERQVFFSTDRLDHQGDARNERRIDPRTSYIESSFFAAPANDTFILRTNECFHTLFSEVAFNGQPQELDATEVFSGRQLEEMKVSRLNGYLSIIACFYKTLDEDAGLMRQWQESPSLQKFDAMKGLFPHLMWGEDWPGRLLNRVDAELVEKLRNEPETLLLKFRQEDRGSLDGFSEEQLRCRASTLRELLVPAGLALPVCAR
ncbi:unnamed protein product, partial [Prorocentrum cordatum]